MDHRCWLLQRALRGMANHHQTRKFCSGRDWGRQNLTNKPKDNVKGREKDVKVCQPAQSLSFQKLGGVDCMDLI